MTRQAVCVERKRILGAISPGRKNLSGFCSIPSLPLNWNSLQDKKMNVFFVAGNAAVVVVVAVAVVPFSQEFQVLIQNSWDSKPSANAHSL